MHTLESVLEKAKTLNGEQITRMSITEACEFAGIMVKIAANNLKPENISRDEWEIIHMTLHFSGCVRERLILEKEYFNNEMDN